MKILTFYQIYYKHRFFKANFFLKTYLLLVILVRFLLNLIFSENRINLDKLIISNRDLLNKDFNYLFEYFNSDKGNFFLNQYTKSKKKKKFMDTNIHYFTIDILRILKIKN